MQTVVQTAMNTINNKMLLNVAQQYPIMICIRLFVTLQAQIKSHLGIKK